MNKRGLVGWDIPMMIIRIGMIVLVAVGIFGLFVISYEYYVDVRDAEAIVLAREVSDCLAGGGILDLNKVVGHEDSLLEYCGFGGDLERIYVKVLVFDSSDSEVGKLEGGDSAALWIRDLFAKADEKGVKVGSVADNVDNVIRYNPGYFVLTHDVLVLKGSSEFDGKIEMEVLIRSDE